MANEQIKQNFKNIANAIRSKTGENGTMTAEEMPSKIESIETGITPSGTLDITENGIHNVEKYEEVDVDVEGYPEPSGTYDIYSNGTYDIKDYAEVDVEVESSSSAPAILSCDDLSSAAGAIGSSAASTYIITTDILATNFPYLVNDTEDASIIHVTTESADNKIDIFDQANVHSESDIDATYFYAPVDVVDGTKVVIKLALAGQISPDKLIMCGEPDYAVFRVVLRDTDIQDYEARELFNSKFYEGIDVIDISGNVLKHYDWTDSSVWWDISGAS